MVEEASAAAGSLEEQSRQLSNAVAAFRLGQEAPQPAPTLSSAIAVPAAKPVPQSAVTEKKAAEKEASAGLKKAPEPHVHFPQLHKAAKRKGNGHAEEGWQEF
jgi:hypothetical protein